MTVKASYQRKNQSELSEGDMGHDIRRDVLQFIGESKKPLSTTEVEKVWFNNIKVRNMEIPTG